MPLCPCCSLLFKQVRSRDRRTGPGLGLLLVGYVRARAGCSSRLWLCRRLLSFTIARPITMPLPSAIRFSNTFRELFFLRGSQVVNIDAIEQTFGIDGLQNLLLHII